MFDQKIVFSSISTQVFRIVGFVFLLNYRVYKVALCTPVANKSSPSTTGKSQLCHHHMTALRHVC